MLSVGIFTGYYPYEVDEVIRRVKAGGFSCVQLDLSFKDCDALADMPSKARAREICAKFRDANLPVVALSAYTNIVHPDKARRAANIAYIKRMTDIALDLGTPYVASETGTFNRESDWVWDDENASESAYQQAAEAIYDIVRHAREVGATFAVENYVNNVIGSIERVQRLFSDINMPNLGLICDPTNYFDARSINDVDGQLRGIFAALADKMVIAHAKDMRIAADTAEKHVDADLDESHSFRGAGDIELPGAGQGALNYPLYLKLLSKRHPNMPLIIEHIEEPEIGAVKAFVDGVLRRECV